MPENEIRQLAAWLQDYLDEQWGKEIKANLALGKLDGLIEIKADIAVNRVRELPGSPSQPLISGKLMFQSVNPALFRAFFAKLLPKNGARSKALSV